MCEWEEGGGEKERKSNVQKDKRGKNEEKKVT